MAKYSRIQSIAQILLHADDTPCSTPILHEAWAYRIAGDIAVQLEEDERETIFPVCPASSNRCDEHCNGRC